MGYKDQGFGKMEFFLEEAVNLNGAKSGITQEGNMSDNAKSIGEDGEFISIAETAVDILLFGIRAGSGL